jgi:hypothetical protein
MALAGKAKFCTNTFKTRGLVFAGLTLYSALPIGVLPFIGTPVNRATRVGITVPGGGAFCALESCVKYKGKTAHIIAPTNKGKATRTRLFLKKKEIKRIVISSKCLMNYTYPCVLWAKLLLGNYMEGV